MEIIANFEQILSIVMSYTAEERLGQKRSLILSRVAEYAALGKMRLSSLVVFSALVGYFIGASSVSWLELLALFSGGFLVTLSSNSFNQIIEKDFDRLMTRTENRPLPQNRLSVTEARWFAFTAGITGVAILWFAFNPLAAILAFLSLFMYVVIYTPLKRIHPIAVFVGAFPGAIPPMLGWVAATGHFGLEAGLLFAMQFMWQFPHFWSIAWKADDDYKKAGFRLLPSAGGKDKTTAFLILVYSLFLIPVSLLPVMFHFAGVIAAIVLILAGTCIVIPAVKLFRDKSMKSATQVMFASFIYLPIALIVLWIDKL